MGLTKSSTGSRLLASDLEQFKIENGYTIALAGNPNVGKSTIFNSLTGMHQHTGNWPGKTVANATGNCTYKNNNFLFVDIPGTYSIMSNSEEEEIARDYICFGNPKATVVVVDSTCLERNLNLLFQIMEITNNVILCVNLLDEAEKKKIKIDLPKLSSLLGIPVVGTTARNKKTLNNLINTIYNVCNNKITCNPHTVSYSQLIENWIENLQKVIIKEYNFSPKLSRWISLKLLDGDKNILQSIEKNLNINLLQNDNINSILNILKEDFSKNNITSDSLKESIISSIVKKSEEISLKVCHFENENYSARDRKIDKILTSKKFGFPLMILFLAIIFWITIVGSNYPSQILFSFFAWIQEKLLLFAKNINCPTVISNMLILGVYQTLTWVISVMLPPMAIFFPLFTFLEDLGYLPRLAFNMDGFFKKCCCSRKTNDYYVYGIWM